MFIQLKSGGKKITLRHGFYYVKESKQEGDLNNRYSDSGFVSFYYIAIC